MTETFIKNTQFQVLTPSGYKNFDGIRIKTVDKILKILLENGDFLECTHDHRFVVDGKEIRAKDLMSEDEIETKDGLQLIFEIEELIGEFKVADLVNTEGSVYFTNSMLSHNCDFSKSGNTVIDAETIEFYEKHCVIPPIRKDLFDRNLWIWKDSEFGKNYILSCDIARGDGGDFSTIIVTENESLEQVAEYKGKLPPKLFGELMVKLGQAYNNAMIVPENNNMGYGAIQVILDSAYPKLYWMKKNENQLFFDPLNWHLPGPDRIPGFATTGKTRPILVSNFEEMLRTRQYIVRSARLLDEIKGFVWVNNGMNIRAQATDMMNDDLVLALCIGIFARNTTLRLSSTDSLQTNALLDSIIIEKGRHSVEGVSIQQEQINKESGRNNPYNINGEDISWILAG